MRHDNAFKGPNRGAQLIFKVAVVSRTAGLAGEDVVAIPPEENAFRVDGHELHKSPTSVQNKACRTYVNATRCAMEWDMWLIVRALVRPHHSVIEFGARYGTTSCMIAAATKNSGRVVAVEPDPSAHAPLLRNRDSHRCNFHVVRGTVAAKKMHHVGRGRAAHGYAYTMAPNREGGNATAEHSAVTVPNILYSDLESTLGVSFDVAVLDCEGCIEQVLFEPPPSRPPLIHQLSLVILEQDNPTAKHATRVDYLSVAQRLHLHNFTRVWWSADTFMPSERWSEALSYSAWVRRDRITGKPQPVKARLERAFGRGAQLSFFGRPLECVAALRRHNFSRSELVCLGAGPLYGRGHG